MKYTLKQLDKQTARIAFESRLPYNSKNKPVIATLCSHAYKDEFLARGLAIGAEGGQHYALLIHVKRRDCVVIKEMAKGRRAFSWKFFRIDENFRPQALDPLIAQLGLQDPDRPAVSVDRAGRELLAGYSSGHPVIEQPAHDQRAVDDRKPGVELAQHLP